MDKDYAELVEYLDKKFEQNSVQVRDLRTEVVVVKEDVKEMKATLSELQETVHELVGAVDKLAKAVDDLRIEYSSMAMQLTRHEKWIQKLAEKLGLKLEY